MSGNDSTRKEGTARSKVDPVAFEIIRRRLAAINDEAAITVMRVSGSQVVTEAGRPQQRPADGRRRGRR